MEGSIEINKMIYFDENNGRFLLTPFASNIIYREKGVICSYSGADEWCHNLFCQLLDVYSGGSKYNYSISTCDHEKSFKTGYSTGHSREIIDWVERTKNKEWFSKAADMMETIINNFPNFYDEGIR